MQGNALETKIVVYDRKECEVLTASFSAAADGATIIAAVAGKKIVVLGAVVSVDSAFAGSSFGFNSDSSHIFGPLLLSSSATVIFCGILPTNSIPWCKTGSGKALKFWNNSGAAGTFSGSVVYILVEES